MIQKVLKPAVGYGRLIKTIFGRGPKGMIFYFAIALIPTWILGNIFSFAAYNSGSMILGKLSTLIKLFQLYMLIGGIYTLATDWQDKEVEDNGDLGRAKFEKDLAKSGLEDSKGGIVFGKREDKLLEKESGKDGHIGIIGGSRTGKTSSNIIPTLLRWQGTGLAVDIKGELFQKTAKYRENKMGNRVFVLDLTNPKVHYDPLKFIREFSDVLDMGATLIPIPPEIKEPYFKQTAQSILASACWEFKDTKSFAELTRWICSNNFETIVETLQKSEKPETKILINVVEKVKETQKGLIFNELRNKLVTYAVDPSMQEITSSSDFTPESIEDSFIYLSIPEHKLEIYGDFLALVVTQFTRYLVTRQEYQNPPVLMALDEFPRLGKMDVVANSIGTLASRNVTMMIVFQSLANLDRNYGQETRKVIMDNLLYLVVHNATEVSSQEYFSKRAGNKTAQVQSLSQSEGYRNEQNFSTSLQTVPLIRPEEFADLKQPILFAYQVGIIQMQRSFWFEDEEMKRHVELGA